MKNEALLNMCDERLRRLFHLVDKQTTVEILPSTIRTLEQQKDFFARGVSKTMTSKHLITPEHPESRAVDAAPWPHRWPKEGPDKWVEWGRLYYFAGIVMRTAYDLKLPLRYGGDWNGNFELKDQNFYDGVHFELTD